MDISKVFNAPKRWIAAGVLGAAVVATPALSCRSNSSGEISVVYDSISGTLDRTHGEGAFLAIPFIQQNIRYDGTKQVVKEVITTQSADNVPVDVDSVIEWELERDALPEIHRKVVGSSKHVDTSSNKDKSDDNLKDYIHNDYNRVFYTKAIRSRYRNLIGDIVKQYVAEKANDHRDDITRALQKGFVVPGTNERIPSLHEMVNDKYVKITDVYIRNVHLPEKLKDALKARAEVLIDQQTALNRIKVEENNALALTQKGIGLANKLREEAQGNADVINKISETLRKNPEYIEYMKAEAQKLAGQNGGLIITNGTPPSILIQQKKQ